MTFEKRLAASGFRPSGFDYLRLVLAILVVCSHSLNTSYGVDRASVVWATPLGRLFQILLPMFFALSGFLVAGSLERSKTVAMFVGLRVIRIYPALVVEVLLSAIILGPMMTTAPLASYFSDPTFFSYAWNVLGDPHYLLPGVFENNPLPRLVNAQLWTIPYELLCYVILGVLALLGGRRNRRIVLLGTIAAMGLALALQIHKHGLDLPYYANALKGPFLVFSFLAGVCLYLYRERVPDNVWIFAAAVAAATFCIFYNRVAIHFIAFPLAYIVAYLGLRNPGRIFLLRGADYSYGIYLYHVAIQQTLMAALPWAREWYWNLALTLPLVSAFAAFSWHVVEKPALKIKPTIARLEKAHLARRELSEPSVLSRFLGWREA